MRKQSGFTLIELAIVLVIIGLLLGGVLKGQELINSAKVKSFATDFRNIPVYIYGYQDKFKALPGDDLHAKTHVGAAENGDGDGALEGNWFDHAAGSTSEAYNFWQHVRLANLANGSTSATDSDWRPTNADGNYIGIMAGTNNATNAAMTDASGKAITGSYVICSRGILGKYVTQLDTNMDNGDPSTGNMLAAENTTDEPTIALKAVKATVDKAGVVTSTAIDPAKSYIVCFGI